MTRATIALTLCLTASWQSTRAESFAPFEAHFTSPSFDGGDAVTAELQCAPDGRRIMHRMAEGGFMQTDYAILPDKGEGGKITGETYIEGPAGVSILRIEFEYDKRGRLTREVLKRPRSNTESDLSFGTGVIGWYPIAETQAVGWRN